MRKSYVGAVALALAATPLWVGATAGASGPPPASREAVAARTAPGQYLVLYADGASPRAARAAVEEAGGTVLSVNARVGLATVRTADPGFGAAVAASPLLAGTARDDVIGRAPDDRAPADSTGSARSRDRAAADLAAVASSTRRTTGARAAADEEPLAGRQWDMQQIHATVDGSYAREPGDPGVLVGVLDTGVDASHPDIAPNFDAELSRNFTTDLPADADGNVIDGPCEDDPDGSCTDPADVDEDGHGTHVASTIAAPLNGIGMAGVAPGVRIVNLRAGQDSGYFFLKPSVDALTYAGDHGIDVVNMSYYVDPWLFNCTSNSADSAEEQAQQRLVITAMQRALNYARTHGVTLVASAGNGAQDFTKPTTDASSPDYATEPGQQPRERTIDPASCTVMPTEGTGVISVTSTGVSTRKAYYSDYGNGYADVAAPGGDAYDTPSNERDITRAILAAYPESLGRASGAIDADGEPTTPSVVKSCADGTCAYYQDLQGSSMASPHAVGVAALIVSRYGTRDRVHGGLTLDPARTARILNLSATNKPCPTPATYVYTRHLPSGSTSVSEATCEGTRASNGFYGRGIVDALRALR